VKAPLAILAALLLLALGFLLGRSATGPDSPAKAVSAPPSPAVDPGLSAELRDLTAALKDSEARVEMLRREIAEQNRRRESLEASLQQALQAPPADRTPGASGATETWRKKMLGWAADQHRRSLADFQSSRRFRQADEDPATAERERLGALARELCGELFLKQDAQDAYVEALRGASVEEAVMLWDLGAGTYLDTHRVPLVPHLKDGLWQLFSEEAEPRKKAMLGRLLGMQGDARITPEMREQLNLEESGRPAQ